MNIMVTCETLIVRFPSPMQAIVMRDNPIQPHLFKDQITISEASTLKRNNSIPTNW